MGALGWYRRTGRVCRRGRVRKLLARLWSRVLRCAVLLEVVDIEAVEGIVVVVVVVVKVAGAGLKHIALSVPSWVHSDDRRLHLGVALLISM